MKLDKATKAIKGTNMTSQGGDVSDIKELGTHVFVAGSEQPHHFNKIKDAIAEHVGTVEGMGMRMRNLVKDSKDYPPKEPTELGEKDAKNQAKMKKHEKELDVWFKNPAPTMKHSSVRVRRKDRR